MIKNKASIGVDIGGTSVKIGLVGAEGKVLARDSFPTHEGGRHQSREDFLRLVSAAVDRLKKIASQKKRVIVGVGIGAPGPVDVERGFVYFFPNIPGWKNTPLKSILEKRLKLPARVDNDASALAWGEFVFGAGRGVKNIVVLTLGTGVGGGIILDGKLFHGHAFSAAEIGHLVIHENGPECACGNRGCLETFVGNGYFVKEAEKRLKSGQTSVLSRAGGKLTPHAIAKAAHAGDPFSIRLWEDTAEHLATALAGLANILNPERIILGGGLAQNGIILFGPLRRALAKKAFPIAARSVKVVPAALKLDAGVVGAAALLRG
ncbi:MAG: ROK family glucokinase [Candidatus Omnitrophica bacterium]|nr:ROK family glucokinase [Candidatus Omnitrophota bacterium]